MLRSSWAPLFQNLKLESENLQAGVVGMSCRSDVAEMLEKRVKSRFSYRRQLVLDPSTSDFDNTDEGPVSILASLLPLQVSVEGSTEDIVFAACYNTSVRAAVSDQAFKARLRRLCDYGESPGILSVYDKGRMYYCIYISQKLLLEMASRS